MAKPEIQLIYSSGDNTITHDLIKNLEQLFIITWLKWYDSINNQKPLIVSNTAAFIPNYFASAKKPDLSRLNALLKDYNQNCQIIFLAANTTLVSKIIRRLDRFRELDIAVIHWRDYEAIKKTVQSEALSFCAFLES